jgi:2-hydroxy-3-oxopropionate reductase
MVYPMVGFIGLGIMVEAIGEAFVLAEKVGVDPDMVFQSIRGGLGGNSILDYKGR